MRLLPGVRLVERPGALHFFDGRRVVSIRGDEQARRAIRQLIGAAAGRSSGPDGDPDHQQGARAAADARELLIRLNLVDPVGGPASGGAASGGALSGRALSGGALSGGALSVGADFASAATGGWVSPRLAQERLHDMVVHVWDDAGALREALAASGLRCEPLAGPEQVAALDPDRTLVAVAASAEQPLSRLRAANDACLRHGVSWLPVGGYDGAGIHVGPLMVPGQTACAECLLRRLAANVEYAGVYGDVAGAPSAPTPHGLRAWSYSVAALILLRWLAGRDAALPGLLVTLAPDDLEMRRARVYRVPRCPACAGPDFVTAAAPWDIARDH